MVDSWQLSSRVDVKWISESVHLAVVADRTFGARLARKVIVVSLMVVVSRLAVGVVGCGQVIP
jgi:hypothetical protein